MSLEVGTVTVYLFTHMRMCERRMDTEKERETACRLWQATRSGELICGEREIEIEIEIER